MFSFVWCGFMGGTVVSKGTERRRAVDSCELDCVQPTLAIDKLLQGVWLSIQQSPLMGNKS